MNRLNRPMGAGQPAFRQRDGFTLMEILVAMVILSIGIVGVIPLFHVSIKHASAASSHAMAANYAKSVKASVDVGLRFATQTSTSPNTWTFTFYHNGKVQPAGTPDAASGVAVTVSDTMASTPGTYVWYPGGGAAAPLPTSAYKFDGVDPTKFGGTRPGMAWAAGFRQSFDAANVYELAVYVYTDFTPGATPVGKFSSYITP